MNKLLLSLLFSVFLFAAPASAATPWTGGIFKMYGGAAGAGNLFFSSSQLNSTFEILVETYYDDNGTQTPLDFCVVPKNPSTSFNYVACTVPAYSVAAGRLAMYWTTSSDMSSFSSAAPPSSVLFNTSDWAVEHQITYFESSSDLSEPRGIIPLALGSNAIGSTGAYLNNTFARDAIIQSSGTSGTTIFSDANITYEHGYYNPYTYNQNEIFAFGEDVTTIDRCYVTDSSDDDIYFILHLDDNASYTNGVNYSSSKEGVPVWRYRKSNSHFKTGATGYDDVIANFSVCEPAFSTAPPPVPEVETWGYYSNILGKDVVRSDYDSVENTWLYTWTDTLKFSTFSSISSFKREGLPYDISNPLSSCTSSIDIPLLNVDSDFATYTDITVRPRYVEKTSLSVFPNDDMPQIELHTQYLNNRIANLGNYQQLAGIDPDWLYGDVSSYSSANDTWEGSVSHNFDFRDIAITPLTPSWDYSSDVRLSSVGSGSPVSWATSALSIPDYLRVSYTDTSCSLDNITTQYEFTIRGNLGDLHSSILFGVPETMSDELSTYNPASALPPVPRGSDISAIFDQINTGLSCGSLFSASDSDISAVSIASVGTTASANYFATIACSMASVALKGTALIAVGLQNTVFSLFGLDPLFDTVFDTSNQSHCLATVPSADAPSSLVSFLSGICVNTSWNLFSIPLKYQHVLLSFFTIFILDYLILFKLFRLTSLFFGYRNEDYEEEMAQYNADEKVRQERLSRSRVRTAKARVSFLGTGATVKPSRNRRGKNIATGFSHQSKGINWLATIRSDKIELARKANKRRKRK